MYKIMKLLKTSYLLMFFFLLSAVVQAEPFSVSIKTIDNRIYSDERAEFLITITNLADSEQDFLISSPDVVVWDVYTVPRSDYLVTVKPGDTRIVKLYVGPLHIISGQYNVRVDIKSRVDAEKITKKLIIDVFREDDPRRDYVPSLKTEVVMNEKLDPKKRAAIKVKIRNLIPKEMKGVVVKISSHSTEVVEDSVTIDLEPKEERTQVFLVTFNPLQEPINDKLSAEISYVKDNKTYLWKSEPVSFEIVSYSTIAATEKQKKGFLSTQTRFNFTNLGNVEAEHVFRQKVSWLKDIFYSASVRGDVVFEDNKRYIEWVFYIGPNETVGVVTASNYRMLFYIAALIAVIIVLYYLLRSPIIIKKSAVSLSKKGEEGMSEIKIRLYVGNRSARPFEDIKIIDKIPHIAEISREFHIGTLKPSEIVRHGKSATIIKWLLPNLEAFEERLITYKISSRLTIVGGLTLPVAVVKYRATNGRIKSVYSNIVSLR